MSDALLGSLRRESLLYSKIIVAIIVFVRLLLTAGPETVVSASSGSIFGLALVAAYAVSLVPVSKTLIKFYRSNARSPEDNQLDEIKSYVDNCLSASEAKKTTFELALLPHSFEKVNALVSLVDDKFLLCISGGLWAKFRSADGRPVAEFVLAHEACHMACNDVKPFYLALASLVTSLVLTPLKLIFLLTIAESDDVETLAATIFGLGVEAKPIGLGPGMWVVEGMRPSLTASLVGLSLWYAGTSAILSVLFRGLVIVRELYADRFAALRTKKQDMFEPTSEGADSNRLALSASPQAFRGGYLWHPGLRQRQQSLQAFNQSAIFKRLSCLLIVAFWTNILIQGMCALKGNFGLLLVLGVFNWCAPFFLVWMYMTPNLTISPQQRRRIFLIIATLVLGALFVFRLVPLLMSDLALLEKDRDIFKYDQNQYDMMRIFAFAPLAMIFLAYSAAFVSSLGDRGGAAISRARYFWLGVAAFFIQVILSLLIGHFLR